MHNTAGPVAVSLSSDGLCCCAGPVPESWQLGQVERTGGYNAGSQLRPSPSVYSVTYVILPT